MSNGNKFNQLITKISLRFLVLAVTAQIIISFFGAAYCAIKLLSSENDNSLNPVLNEYTDITPEIVNGIISNKFKSITISYEFTRCRKPNESAEEYQYYRNTYNPFVTANNQYISFKGNQRRDYFLRQSNLFRLCLYRT